MKIKIGSSVIMVALLLGCSTEFSDNPFLNDPPESFDALMDQGWAAFESEHYDLALEAFSEAAERKATVPEVYLGLGWSSIRSLNLQDGKVYLGSAIAFAFLDEANGDQIIIDSQSGLAGIALAEGDYDAVLDYVDLVTSASSDYSFAHDAEVNIDALLRLRMTALYYQGEYATVFEEILNQGIVMASLSRETPAQATINSFSIVDSGTVMSPGDTLKSDWLQATVTGHGLELNDYVVLSGIEGAVELAGLVAKVTRSSGFKLKYVLDSNTFLLTSLSNDESAQLGSLGLNSAVCHEATGLAVATVGSELNGQLKVNVYTDRQLVYVNSVAPVIDNGSTYSVTSITPGANQINIFGNPVFSPGERVSVDYFYAISFGSFLSELIELVGN